MAYWIVAVLALRRARASFFQPFFLLGFWESLPFLFAGHLARRAPAAAPRPVPVPPRRHGVSWAAHDLEPYLFRAKLGGAISLPLCLVGSYSPDILTKWAVYGLDFSGNAKIVDDPVQLHRGFPGVGFTHSLLFGVRAARRSSSC